MSCRNFVNKPNMPKSKYKGMHEITESNIGKVMGDINRFLSKPTKRFCAMEYPIIGMTYNRNRIPSLRRIPIYSKKLEPFYQPYIGGECDIHFMRKNKDDFFISLLHIKEEGMPLLSIQTRYEESVIPIFIGDRYKVYGNRLVIYCKKNQLNSGNAPYDRYIEFLNVNSINENDVFEYKIRRITSFINTRSVYFKENVNNITQDPDLAIDIKNIADVYANSISNTICNAVRNNIDKDSIKTSVSLNGITVDISLRPKDIINASGNDNEIVYSCDSYGIDNTIDLYTLLAYIIIKDFENKGKLKPVN